MLAEVVIAMEAAEANVGSRDCNSVVDEEPLVAGAVEVLFPLRLAAACPLVNVISFDERPFADETLAEKEVVLPKPFAALVAVVVLMVVAVVETVMAVVVVPAVGGTSDGVESVECVCK
jgi:hypothetical protein